MKRLAAILVLLFALLVPLPAHTQTPTDAPVTTTEVSTGKPWMRLVIFVPIAIVIGVGGVVVKRKLRDVGWIDS